MKQIKALIEKYFEGQTSCEEESRLRRYFAAEEVAEELEVYRPLFLCLDEEVRQYQAASAPAKARPRRIYRLLYYVGGMAAGLLLLVGITRLTFSADLSAGSYVIIDGVRYTDASLVESKAREALLNVGFTDEELSNLLFPY